MNVKQSPLYPGYLWRMLLAVVCLASAFSLSAEERFERGLLWKIQPESGAASYLFGTMHSDNPQVVNLPAPVQQAFEAATGLVVEVELNEQALMSMTGALLLSDGRNLEALVGKALYQRTVTALSAQGMPDFMIARLKPWAAAISLMTPPPGNGVMLDQALYQRALAGGKKVRGLETVAEQMGLFDSLTEAEQLSLLRDTLDNLGDIERQLDEVLVAYLDRDLQRLLDISKDSMQGSDSQLAERFMKKVIDDRNHRMAQRMQPHLQAGRYFIAVGALHLPGKEGLLKLLSERGYRVTRVY